MRDSNTQLDSSKINVVFLAVNTDDRAVIYYDKDTDYWVGHKIDGMDNIISSNVYGISDIDVFNSLLNMDKL
jgi:hypothetical protein